MKSFCLFFLVSALFLGFGAVPPADAQLFTVLHSFDDGTVSNDGSYPGGLILGNDGNLYGVTPDGGPFPTAGGYQLGYGTAYKITPSGTVTILHNFNDGSVPGDGFNPMNLVQGSDGNFYGVTEFGGSTTASDPDHLGSGTIFKMTPAGTVTILHSFHDGSIPNDGDSPTGLFVQGADGNFYGTATHGGLIFKITPLGAMMIIGSQSVQIASLILGSDGNFYGTSIQGDSELDGSVFKMTPSGTFTTLHNFGDGSVPNDGSQPVSLVQGSDGNFYGLTYSGGQTATPGQPDTGDGTVYKMTPSGTITILHDFGDGSVPNDGQSPTGALIQATDGNFYGITHSGGSTTTGVQFSGLGTIFKITSSGQETVVRSFGDGSVTNDSAYPNSSLVQGSDGSFYGTSLYGGSTVAADPAHLGYGTVYRLTGPTPSSHWNAVRTAAAPDGTARLLWTRSDGAAGLWSMSQSDTQAAVGAVYGPYSGWHATDVSAAGDGTARVLWTNSNGVAGLWSFNAAGVATTVGPAYGPYTGWHAASLATAPDGTSRLLWTRTDGAAGVWTLDASGRQRLVGPVYGPYTGWTAKAVGTSGDGTARILWSRNDGAAGIWTLTTGDTLQNIGATYGPYSDSHGTWSATDMGTSSDGTAQVLWSRSDGAVGIWSFNAGNEAALAGPVYGPYTGYTAASLNAANDQARVLWIRTDQAAGLWTIGGDDAMSTIGSVYGPF